MNSMNSESPVKAIRNDILYTRATVAQVNLDGLWKTLMRLLLLSGLTSGKFMILLCIFLDF